MTDPSNDPAFIPDLPTSDPRLGRVPSPLDVRDGLYPMSASLPAAAAVLPSYRYWTPGPILNQGSTPHCVGFAWAQWMQATPVRTPGGNVLGHTIYADCKLIDGIPGVDGTYVRAGAKVLDSEGRVAEYRWAQTLDDLQRWILSRGPVVVGTNWYQTMSQPDARSGLMVAQGAVIGGHAYLLRGYSRLRKQFRVVNSWGESWGQGGQAWIDESTMWALIASGEAVAAVERAV